jgi:hypothetical protein
MTVTAEESKCTNLATCLVAQQDIKSVTTSLRLLLSYLFKDARKEDVFTLAL